MENQLPFWTLTEIRPDIEEWFESALKNLSPIKVADEVNDRHYKPKEKSESHILQLLHDYIVDSQPRSSLDCFTILLWNCVSCLFSCFDRLLSYQRWRIRKISKHVPTVEELKGGGVKFKRLKGKKEGISHIEFKSSTVYLPQFEVDDSSEVILRNLIALEICSQEKEKPVTRYAILMNDLINTSGDVAILRQEDIIDSKLGSDEVIAKLWNSMLTSTEMFKFKPIDDAVTRINEYRKNWWKVRWAQFLMTHCSKPWLFLSILAGVIILGLTIVQVVCQFGSCQIN